MVAHPPILTTAKMVDAKQKTYSNELGQDTVSLKIIINQYSFCIRDIFREHITRE